MALTILSRKAPKEAKVRGERAPRAPFVQNDLLLSTKKTKAGDRDIFTISRALFESTQLNDAAFGGVVAIDTDTNKAYLAVIPATSEAVEIFKARNGERFQKKSEEFQHKNLVEFFVKQGIVSETRELGSNFGFALTSSSEVLEGAIGVYEITPTELVGRAAKKAEGGNEATSEVSTDSEAVASTPEVVEETPVVAQAVTATQDDWDE